MSRKSFNKNRCYLSIDNLSVDVMLCTNVLKTFKTDRSSSNRDSWNDVNPTLASNNWMWRPMLSSQRSVLLNQRWSNGNPKIRVSNQRLSNVGAKPSGELEIWPLMLASQLSVLPEHSLKKTQINGDKNDHCNGQ